MATQEPISPDLYRDERYMRGKFTCGICGMQWPMKHHRLHRDGKHVGVVCCYEPDGDSVVRDLRRAAANIYAGQMSAKELQPPKTPEGYPYSGLTDLIDTDPSIVSFSPTLPVALTRGGAAVSVTVTGVNFAAGDVFQYGASGITDASAPVLVSTTEWDLSVQASGAMSAGQYGLVFNPSTTADIWQAVFSVR